jgi:hypothetical protein
MLEVIYDKTMIQHAVLSDLSGKRQDIIGSDTGLPSSGSEAGKLRCKTNKCFGSGNIFMQTIFLY